MSVKHKKSRHLNRNMNEKLKNTVKLRICTIIGTGKHNLGVNYG